MSSTGIGARLAAAVSAQALRVVGLSAVLLSLAVTSTSVATEYGLAVTSDGGTQTTAYVADAGVVPALLAFSVAHPAYPAAALVGLLLVVGGEDTPLLGS